MGSGALSRWERWFLVTFALSHLVVPLFVADLYPWTSMPMFTSAPSSYVEYAVFAPDGAPLDAIEFGVFRNDFANPAPRVGVDLPFTVFARSADPDPEDVRRQVRDVLGRKPDLRYVELRKRRIAPLADGASAVGVVAEERWRVDPPR